MTVTPTTHDALSDILEREYSAVNLATDLFTTEQVAGFMALANIGNGNMFPRMPAIAANAYNAWPVSQQEDFKLVYDIPNVVRDLIALTPSWPEQLSFDDTLPAEMTTEQITAYKTRKSTEIDIYAEEQSLRIMTPGFGKVLTYVWKINEAQKLLAQVANSETPDMAQYPFINAEIGSTAPDAVGVANVIMQTAYVWVNCRATMEGAIFASRAEIETANVDDVPGIVATAKATIKGAADFVIALKMNTAPVTADDVIDVAVNGSLNFDPRLNDTDAQNNALTITQIDGTDATVGSPVTVTNGSVTLESDGTLTFTPATDYAGSFTFTYTVNDGMGGSTTGTVTARVNTAPVVVDDSISTAINTAINFDPRSNDTDAQSDPLTITGIDGNDVVVGTPVAVANGDVVLESDGTLTLTPATDYAGTFTFTYNVSDGLGGTATGTVTVTVS